MTKPQKITVNTYGGAPFATHNMPCPVCRNNHAVLDLGTGVMQPCWECQGNGWTLVKATGKITEHVLKALAMKNRQ